MIDSNEASQTLADLNDIAERVRQSTIYNLASLMLIMWGGLVFSGNLISFFWPRGGNGIWLAIDVVGIAGSFAISALSYPKTRTRTFDFRMLAAFVLLIAFGIFTSRWLGHFTPRQMGAFWTTYFMLFYTIVGLWFGAAFVVIGLGVTVLTLLGYFFSGGWFEPYMALVNGGGLILGGLWMRRN